MFSEGASMVGLHHGGLLSLSEGAIIGYNDN